MRGVTPMYDGLPTAYPLQWPHGRARTPAGLRRVAAFHRVNKQYISTEGNSYVQRSARALTTAEALRRLQHETSLLYVNRLVVSTNVELRQNGLPYSNRREPDDPGAAVYFFLDGDPVALACDIYTTVADNITAIAKHIEASRGIARWGVGSLREIFRGYVALPSATAPNDWRAMLDEPTTLAQAEAQYRTKIQQAHPDKGGSHEDAAALNAAIALARRHYARTLS